VMVVFGDGEVDQAGVLLSWYVGEDAGDEDIDEQFARSYSERRHDSPQ